jgi:inward rectifier potassium channel
MSDANREVENSAQPGHEGDDHSDLGFGRFVAQHVRGRFLRRDGTPVSRKYGVGTRRTERAYLAALNASWPRFFGWLFGILLLVNGCFALVYLWLGNAALGGESAPALSDPFLRALSFSVGVFTTTGSTLQPATPTAHWVAIFESLMGPLTLVAAAGLLIARLTRPRVRLMFSESAVVAPYEGGRGLMFRMVNPQLSELSDVRVQLNLAWFEEVEGKRERNFHRLELERDSVEFFTLHWTVVHPITAESPLCGLTPAKLRESEAEFLVSVNAHEETFSTRVTARTSYWWEDVTWDAKFASIFASAPDGVIAIDVERLGRLDRLEEGATSVPSQLETAPGQLKLG